VLCFHNYQRQKVVFFPQFVCWLCLSILSLCQQDYFTKLQMNISESCGTDRSWEETQSV